MGREIRRVPPNWDHPRTMQPSWDRLLGRTVPKMAYQPLEDESLREAQEEWDEGERRWNAGEDKSALKVYDEESLRWAEERAAKPHATQSDRDYAARVRERQGMLIWESYADYHGERPPFYRNDNEQIAEGDWYRPEWPESERTAFQVYETVSEGTPVSPVFKTEEALIAWLCDPSRDPERLPLMSREAAEKFVRYGSVPSLMIKDGVIASTVEMLEPAFSDD